MVRWRLLVIGHVLSRSGIERHFEGVMIILIISIIILRAFRHVDVIIILAFQDIDTIRPWIVPSHAQMPSCVPMILFRVPKLLDERVLARVDAEEAAQDTAEPTQITRRSFFICILILILTLVVGLVIAFPILLFLIVLPAFFPKP